MRIIFIWRCTAVKLNDVTFLRRRLPRRQDSVEHDKSYIGVSARRDKIDVFLNLDNTAVELYDVIFRRLRLPRRDVSAKVYDVTFRRLGLSRNNIFAEHDKNYSEVSAIEYSIAVDLNDAIFRRPRLPRRNVPTYVMRRMTLIIGFSAARVFRQTNRPAGEMMTIYG